MQLSEIQEGFRKILLNQPAALETPPEDFAALFAAGDIPLPERLKVYRNNVVGSLTETMRAHFPLVEKLVGEDFFKMMARSYILARPPEGGCLNAYGADFDELIALLEPAKILPYLSDVARFEAALHAAYHAKDDEPLRAEDLATLKPEEIRLVLRDSVRLVASAYPLRKIRDFCRDGADGTLDISSGSESLLIYRPLLEVEIVPVGAASYRMLEEIAAGKTLGAALENTLLAHPDFDFPAFLQIHVSQGTFRRCAI
jgi:hypothetical protein